MSVLAELSNYLIAGDEAKVTELTRQALAQGLAPKQILDDGLIGGMGVVGQRFKAHEIYLPDVLMAAQAMYAGLTLLRPLLEQEGLPSLGKVVLGSVQGDLHDIGKNLVGILLRGAGYDVIDLGSDVPPEKFLEAAMAHDAPVIGMSALLTTTMPAMKAVIELLQRAGVTGRIKTIIGGAPVTEKYAREIGADAYGYDAANAVERVQSLMGRR